MTVTPCPSNSRPAFVPSCTEFVYPGWWHFDNGATSTLNMLDYLMSFPSLSTRDCFWWTSRGDHSKMFLLFEFCCGTPPSCLKVRGWVEPESMWWSQSLCGGLQHFSVSPRPLLSLLGLHSSICTQRNLCCGKSPIYYLRISLYSSIDSSLKLSAIMTNTYKL